MALQQNVVSPDELRSRASDLVPMLRDLGRRHEQDRMLSSEAMQAMLDADLFRTLQPSRYGGFEHDFALHLDLATEIGRGDAASGWVYGVLGDHQWLVGLFAEQAQDDVWGDDRSHLISASYAPITTAEIVPGGYRVSGTWSFGSGCDYAGWHMIGVLLPDPADGQPAPGLLLVPRNQYRIEDTWDVVGMAGTGSKDVVVEDLFVPAHRAISFAAISGSDAPGTEVNTAPLFRMPFASVVTIGLIGPVLGATLGALEEFIQATRERVSLGGATRGRSKVSESPLMQMRLARASGLIDAAQLLVKRDITEATDVVQDGASLSVELRTRLRRDYALAGQMCLEALDEIFAASGARAMNLRNRVQRSWRDAHMITQHVGLLWDTNSLPSARYALGLEPQGQY